MKFFAYLLALPAILLPSLAAPVADRDVVASSEGQNALAYPVGFNIALKPQDSIKSLSHRSYLESTTVAQQNYGLGPLKNFTWHLQMQAEEIHGICQVNYHWRHFPDYDVQGALVSNMSAIISFLEAADLSNVAKNYQDYHQEYRQPELRQLLAQNVELIGGVVANVVRTKPLNEFLTPICHEMLKAMFGALRPLWPLINGSVRNASIQLEGFLHDYPGWRDISNVLDKMLDLLKLSP